MKNSSFQKLINQYRKYSKINNNPNLHRNEFFKTCKKTIRHWWLLIIGVLIGLLISVIYYKFIAISGFQSDATLYIQTESHTEEQYEMSTEEAKYNLEAILMDTATLETVREKLNLKMPIFQLRSMISFDKSNSSPVFTLLITAENPEVSEKISNDLLEIALSRLKEIYPEIIIEILEPASSENICFVTPSFIPIVVKGILTGIFLELIITYILIFIQNSFENGEEMKEILHLYKAWEISQKDIESINRFCGTYLLKHQDIENLGLIFLTPPAEVTIIQTIKELFESYGKKVICPSLLQSRSKQQNESVIINSKSNQKKSAPNGIIKTANYKVDNETLLNSSRTEKEDFHDEIRNQSETMKTENDNPLTIHYAFPSESQNAAVFQICDDVLLILKKEVTKRRHAWQLIADLQEKGILINGAILIV